MAGYRLTHTAQPDIVAILAWTDDQFGEEARSRYQTLIATAIRDASSPTGAVAHTPRPELGDDVISWHLAQSRTHAPGTAVGLPRHFLICRREGDLAVIGRVLHEAMEPRRHVDARQTWD
ncbi:plasmid stabilization protein ParE [Bacillus sp. SRB_336]|nr:plasmid stabilization protein ParE [Bacillus sp. SRB_336]